MWCPHNLLKSESKFAVGHLGSLNGLSPSGQVGEDVASRQATAADGSDVTGGKRCCCCCSCEGVRFKLPLAQVLCCYGVSCRAISRAQHPAEPTRGKRFKQLPVVEPAQMAQLCTSRAGRHRARKLGLGYHRAHQIPEVVWGSNFWQTQTECRVFPPMRHMR
eukprot:s3043_g3.t2